MITFVPYPFPVETPLGQGYVLYITPAPMFENDAWCVVLDDGRLLHFSTNQFRYTGNGTYDMDRPAAVEPPDPQAFDLVHSEGLPCGVAAGATAVLRQHITCPACAAIADLRKARPQAFKREP